MIQRLEPLPEEGKIPRPFLSLASFLFKVRWEVIAKRGFEP